MTTKPQPQPQIVRSASTTIGGQTLFTMWYWARHTPHWKVSDCGRAALRVSTSMGGRWVSLRAYETASNGYTKEVMLELTAPEAIRALRDQLNLALLEDEAERAALAARWPL